jgi:hypothetical protein
MPRNIHIPLICAEGFDLKVFALDIELTIGNVE